MSAQLRDIHTLDPAPFWPPAPGWWLLLAGILVAATLTLIVIRWMKQYPPGSWQREARNALRQLKRRQHLLPPKTAASQLSELLRRIAMARFGRDGHASLSGEAWLDRLSESDPTGFDWRKQGRILLHAPYAPETDDKHRRSVEMLIDAALEMVALSREDAARAPRGRWKRFLGLNHV